MVFKSAIDSLAAVFFPAPCGICGQTLITASRIPICASCLSGFERITDPLCACCGRPLVAPVSQHNPLDREAGRELRCRLCRSGFYAFHRARSFAVYDRALSEAVLLLKYDQIASLADWFGTRLSEIATAAGSDWCADVVVPVPLHRDRQRERGYNQAELIAKAVAHHLKLRLESRLMVRVKPRPAQLVLSRSEHWKSVRGAYATREGIKIDNMRILLIDDVLTTGATLDACSRALTKAGAATVFGLTVGRVRSGPVAGVPAHPVANDSATKLARKRI